jgi:flagellar biosynthesis/type III secretory pathway protein FliH
MSFHLAHADGHTLLTSDRAVIKRRDRATFADALMLLHETTSLRDHARGSADEARDEARREGLAEARLAAQETLAGGLAEIAAAIEAHAETRRADIAEAAFAAARAIVGELDDDDVMQRIIDRTITRMGGDKPLTIEVAPSLAAALSKHLAEAKHITIAENVDFGSTDCRILSDSGQIVASLAVQFDALAARWGL